MAKDDAWRIPGDGCGGCPRDLENVAETWLRRGKIRFTVELFDENGLLVVKEIRERSILKNVWMEKGTAERVGESEGGSVKDSGDHSDTISSDTGSDEKTRWNA